MTEYNATQNIETHTFVTNICLNFINCKTVFQFTSSKFDWIGFDQRRAHVKLVENPNLHSLKANFVKFPIVFISLEILLNWF